jgi:hypothetical protein
LSERSWASVVWVIMRLKVLVIGAGREGRLKGGCSPA